MSNKLLPDDKTSVIDSQTVHIDAEDKLSENIFKTLCFFYPTIDGTFKCKLDHQSTGVTTFEKSRTFMRYISCVKHLKMCHKLNNDTIKSLSEYKDVQKTISLTSLVRYFFIIIFVLNFFVIVFSNKKIVL